MNRTHSTDNTDQSVKRAEQDVQNSLHRFEVAMEHLADKVEVPAQTLHRVQEVARKGKRKVKQVQDVIQNAAGMIQHSVVDPVAPYVEGQAYQGRAIGDVRGNPRTLLIAAVGLVGGLAALMYLRRRNTWAAQMATNVVRKSARKFLFI